MSHWIIAPVVLPALVAAVMIILLRGKLMLQRLTSVAAQQQFRNEAMAELARPGNRARHRCGAFATAGATGPESGPRGRGCAIPPFGRCRRGGLEGRHADPVGFDADGRPPQQRGDLPSMTFWFFPVTGRL